LFSEEKVAATVVSALSVTLQVLVPEQPPPDQPVKRAPAFAAAVRVTCVPAVKLAVHVAPQLIPVGLLLMVPDPPPAFCTVKTWCGGAQLLYFLVAVALRPEVV
jgi:hypothetical protein